MGVRRARLRDLHGQDGDPRFDDGVQPQFSRGVSGEVAGQPVSRLPVSPQQRHRGIYVPGVCWVCFFVVSLKKGK